jgi:hypothetical protein
LVDGLVKFEKKRDAKSFVSIVPFDTIEEQAPAAETVQAEA